MDQKRELLRHALATIAYRGGKTLRDAPESFAAFDGCGRTPGEILAHMGDLFDWSLRILNGDKTWKVSEPLPWDAECARFYATLGALDAFLASDAPLQAPLDNIFQGPVADALTHVGQLAMMRRMAGSPTRRENYFVADIRIGHVGREQAEAARR